MNVKDAKLYLLLEVINCFVTVGNLPPREILVEAKDLMIQKLDVGKNTTYWAAGIKLMDEFVKVHDRQNPMSDDALILLLSALEDSMVNSECDDPNCPIHGKDPGGIVIVRL